MFMPFRRITFCTMDKSWWNSSEYEYNDGVPAYSFFPLRCILISHVIGDLIHLLSYPNLCECRVFGWVEEYLVYEEGKMVIVYRNWFDCLTSDLGQEAIACSSAELTFEVVFVFQDSYGWGSECSSHPGRFVGILMYLEVLGNLTNNG